MPDAANQPLQSKRVLDPIDRISEALLGLIMAMTFTCSLGAADAGRNDVRAMLIGALGCNIAWGLIDGVLYLMGCLAEKGRNLRTYRAVRQAKDPRQACRMVADALPPLIAAGMTPEELETMRQRLVAMPEPPEHASLGGRDWLGGFGVFWVVFLATFPVVIPFMCMGNAVSALRVSNLIAIGLLFLLGCAFGRLSGFRPLSTGVVMVLLSIALVLATMALGG